MIFIESNELHDGIFKSLMALKKEGKNVIAENQDREEGMKEIRLCLHVTDVSNPTISYVMPTDLYGLVEYELELVEGVRDYLSDGLDYTYHAIFGEYINDCIAELKRNHKTRRAVLPVAGDKSYGTKYPPCLQDIMFKIHDGKLDTTVIFRSNDALKASAMNMFGLVRLAHKIASEVGVGVGSYTHFADSYHCYNKDFNELDKIENAANKYFEFSEYLEVYDEYAGEFREKQLEKAKSLISE